MSLSKRKRLFVESFMGDVAEAARLAGFDGSPSYLERKGAEIFADPNVQNAIAERSKYEVKTRHTIATRQERQEWWTSIMKNDDPYALPEYDEFKQPKPKTNIPLATRLAASVNLAKSEGDFITNVNVQGNVSITDLVEGSYRIGEDEDLDAIEAEYERVRLGGLDEEEIVDSKSTEDTDGKPTDETVDVNSFI